MNCPVNAYIHAKAPINKTPLPGTSDAFNFPNALYPGIIFWTPSVYATLDPDNINPFNAPKTDINIPAAIIFPPTGPNITSATATAGDEQSFNWSAGKTQR